MHGNEVRLEIQNLNTFSLSFEPSDSSFVPPDSYDAFPTLSLQSVAYYRDMYSIFCWKLCINFTSWNHSSSSGISLLLQQITPSHAAKPDRSPQIHRPIPAGRRQSPRTWRIHDGAKGFSARPKGGESAARKGGAPTSGGEDDDDRIPDVVWERMIKRILSYVGVPLVLGFALLKGFDVVIEKGMWKVPLWVPFLTTLLTFGASALGIAYGSLSTSLDEAEEGSLLGFEQVQKNWVEMWKED